MTYTQFKNRLQKLPIISVRQFFDIGQHVQVIRNQLNRWQKKGLVIKLKKGLYVLNENDRKIHPSRIFLANAIYSPSYVSTEYVLGYYDLIPEKVQDVTCITTKKTAKFTNAFGTFVYQHVKTELFFGFKEIQDENKLPVLIAEPEKAMLDFIYLNLSNFKNKNKDVFTESYRFQNLGLLKRKKLIEYARRYNNKAVLNIVEKLLEFVKESA